MTDRVPPPEDQRWYPPTGFRPPADPPGVGDQVVPEVGSVPARRRGMVVAVGLLVAVVLAVVGLANVPRLVDRVDPAPTPTALTPPSSSTSKATAAATPRSAPTASSMPRTRTAPLPAPQDLGAADAVTRRSAFYRAEPGSRMPCADADPARMSVRQLRAWAQSTLDRCLMPYWAPAFLAATGYTLPSPEVVVLDGQTVQTPCGTSSPTHNEAFFCSGNDTIYLWSRNIIGSDDPRLAVTYLVLAHEFGHHLQWAAAILGGARVMTEADGNRQAEISRRTELQASCLGARFLSAIAVDLSRFQRARFPANVVTGDRRGARDHGSVSNNRRWLDRGYRSTAVSRCNTFVAPASEVS